LQHSAIDTIKTLIEAATVPFTIHAVALFGSAASGKATECSDVDLLVIAEGLNEKYHRRSAEIVSIKHALPGMSLDVLLLTRAEAESNFDNHNPLFLDIAEQGVIVTDPDDFLGKLMQKTREDIKARGLKKFRDAWRFPVKAGVATYLSEVSNCWNSRAFGGDGTGNQSEPLPRHNQQ